MTSVLEFEWFVGPRTQEEDDVLRAIVAELSTSEPVASVEVRTPTRDALPVEPETLSLVASSIVCGVAALRSLGGAVAEFLCRLRRPGVVIDARTLPVTIEESQSLAGGTVVLITDKGRSEIKRVCSDTSAVERLLIALSERDASKSSD